MDHTLTSISPILLTARIMGRPTIEGKNVGGEIAAGISALNELKNKWRCHKYIYLYYGVCGNTLK